MRLYAGDFTVSTRTRGLANVTSEVARIVAASQIQNGLVHVFVRHTSASLVIQENADPAVLRDLAAWMARLAPEDAGTGGPGAYEHADEGPDDMPGHLRSAVTRTSETIPVRNGAPALGTWQALYLWEHRVRAPTRSLAVTVWGD